MMSKEKRTKKRGMLREAIEEQTNHLGKEMSIYVSPDYLISKTEDEIDHEVWIICDTIIDHTDDGRKLNPIWIRFKTKRGAASRYAYICETCLSTITWEGANLIARKVVRWAMGVLIKGF